MLDLANIEVEQKQYKSIKKVDFINIDCDSNYFNTKEQVQRNSVNYFVDTFSPSVDKNTGDAIGLFSKQGIAKDDVVYNSKSHATSSTVVDPSGNGRKILSLDIDYYASSSVYSYRNGVEITQEKHWTAGLVKITAGTPGHLYKSQLYGYSDVSIVSQDTYYEIDVFDPIKYVETGGDVELFTYPIITSDTNQIENYILNGIIEPFPIRPVISNFSINFPFEPRSVKGDFGNGNLNTRFATDSVVSLDYYTPGKQTATPYLDAVGVIGVESDDGTGVVVGPSFGYFSIDDNKLPPFEDVVYPRGEVPPTTSYGSLIDVVNLMPPQETTYVNRKTKSTSCGFIYDNASKGTDSIAYGGLLY